MIFILSDQLSGQKTQILPRHLAEFWMIEPEMAFYDLNDNMDLAEEFVKYLIRYALENCNEDLEFLNNMIDKALLERLKFVLE